MTDQGNRIRPGVPVAVAALAFYAMLTSLVATGPLQIALAVIAPLLGMAVAIAIAVKRLGRPGTDGQRTKLVFETAAALLMAAPVLGIATWLVPEATWIDRGPGRDEKGLAVEASPPYNGRQDDPRTKGPAK